MGYALLSISVIFFLVKVSSGFSTVAESRSTKERSCEYNGTITKTAYYGWPFELACEDGIPSEVYSAITEKLENTCVIKAWNGAELRRTANSSRSYLSYFDEYLSIDLASYVNSTFSIEIQVPKSGYCAITKVRVLIEIPNKENYNCHNYSHAHDNKFDITLGTQIEYIRCQVGLRNISLYGIESEYEYEWWYNCSRTLPENVVVDKKEANKLQIRNVSFANGGEYLCAVKYNNQRKFLVRYNVCVKRGPVSFVSMACPKKIKGKEGFPLNITCHVDGGIGRLPILSDSIQWYNSTTSGDTKICLGEKKAETSSDTFPVDGNSDVICDNVQSQDRVLRSNEELCFRYSPPAEIDVTPTVKYNITLHIENLRKWHKGTYTVMLIVSDSNKITEHIEVALDNTGQLINRSVSVGIGVAIFALFILFVIISYWRRHDILWYYKKRYGPYEEEMKSHDVVLVYHYSRSDMNPASKVQTERFIDTLHTFLEEIGMTVYDENKEDTDFQLQVQNMARIQDDCHRILIVLNMEIAFDEWNLHKVYTAIKNFAEGGSNVIFIPLPGMKKKFREAPNASKVALKHAMELGTSIDWSGKIPFDTTFKRRLEYVLPKKKPNRDENLQASPNRRLFNVAMREV